jgi:hypothetical protein
VIQVFLAFCQEYLLRLFHLGRCGGERVAQCVEQLLDAVVFHDTHTLGFSQVKVEV